MIRIRFNIDCAEAGCGGSESDIMIGPSGSFGNKGSTGSELGYVVNCFGAFVSLCTIDRTVCSQTFQIQKLI